LAVKLLMSWDIAPDREQEYFEFVVREFIPGIQRLGLELNEAWATVYGDQPQILVGALMPSVPKLTEVMRTSEWKQLNDQLLEFVKNYQYKVINAQGGFQF
jgi:hypothetical protein